MIEELAIIALVFLNQLNVLPADQESIVFLDQFIKKESVRDNVNSEEKNWSYYSSNLALESSLQPLPYKISSASDFDSNTKAAVVLDVGTDAVLYFKNSNERLPIASLTKIMTALIVLEKTNLEDIVTISENAANVEKTKNGLSTGEKISAENLLKIMLIDSNNVAAVALAEYTSGNMDEFVKLMNGKAKLLGLKQTNFSNPAGLDESGNYSTAYDVAQLMDYAADKPPIWDILRTQKLTLTSVDGKIKHRLKNTNLLLGKLKNITGGKTGFTDEAGQCLALIVGDPKEKHRIISVVLGAEDRFSETGKLVKWVFENYRW